MGYYHVTTRQLGKFIFQLFAGRPAWLVGDGVPVPCTKTTNVVRPFSRLSGRVQHYKEKKPIKGIFVVV